MAKTSVEIREERATLIKDAREKWSVAEAREGGPTAEDKQEFDRIMAKAADQAEDIRRLDSLESAERGLDEPAERRGDPLKSENRGKGRTPAEYRASKEYEAVYGEWLRTGHVRAEKIPAEYRDTIIGTDAKGGYLSTPTKLADQIVKQCDDLVFVRELATVIRLTDAKSLGIPQLSTRMGDANWTTEVQSVTEDTTMALGRRDLTPIPLTKLSKVSIRMLYGMTGVEQFLVSELGYKNAVSEEKGYLTGTGSAQPLGVFTGSANGIPTSRDVATGNTTTAFVADNLFAVKYSLKAPYLADPSCRWCFHRDGVKMAMTLKDSQNRYLWEPSLQAGTPDRLLNVPVMTSEYAPNTFTTGLYVGILGAFKYYWIAEVDDLQIQRLVELYAATNEVGFISRRYLDGSPALGEAFARVKLG